MEEEIHEAIALAQTIRTQWEALWRAAQTQAHEVVGLRAQLAAEQQQAAACRAELACVHEALTACLRQDDEVAALRERAAALEAEVRRTAAERQVDATRARAEREALETQLARSRAALEGEVAASEGLRAEVRELRAALAAKRTRPNSDTPDAIDETTPTSSQKRRAAARAAEAPPLAEKFPFLTQVCPVAPRRSSTKSRKRKCNSDSNSGSSVPFPLDFCQVPEF